ncbi:hypothetical protein [Paraflavitalea speifideaquila]|uniref:hypothetical protein n=1 Tax=Paraflavitalea speifideaquila TaxID=3076558 RepID=UPI0028EF2FF7|nr:hypothetical protein [Paraflavitalea speifideiaquila]
MPPNKEKDDAMLAKAKASAFNWLATALISVVIWIVTDMRSDLKTVMSVIPVMRLQIEYLQDGQLKSRLNSIPVVPSPAKHEEPITYDSLTNK